jgi:hypothetical protein
VPKCATAEKSAETGACSGFAGGYRRFADRSEGEKPRHPISSRQIVASCLSKLDAICVATKRTRILPEGFVTATTLSPISPTINTVRAAKVATKVTTKMASQSQPKQCRELDTVNTGITGKGEINKGKTQSGADA